MTTTGNYLNTSNNNIGTVPEKKNNFPTQENEKINENGFVTNPNIYIQTNANNFKTEINKPNKFQVNQTNYKFIETINNNNLNNNNQNNDRNNTVQANQTSLVQLSNNENLRNSKMHTSMNKSMYKLF